MKTFIVFLPLILDIFVISGPVTRPIKTVIKKPAKSDLDKICYSHFEMKSNGVAKKIGCLVPLEKNFTDARQYCVANGFNGLFAINSKPDYDGVIAFHFSLWQNPLPGTKTHLDGTEIDKQWKNVDQLPVYVDAVPKTGKGNRLNIQGTWVHGYEFVSALESQSKWFMCEFVLRH